MSEKTEVATRERVTGRPRLLIKQKAGFVYCPGCHHPLVARAVAEVLEELKVDDKAIGVFDIGCNSFLVGLLDIDGVLTPHGRPPDMATAVKHIYPDNVVFTIQGDGGLLSIGADPLMGALSRAEKITLIMLNNAVYGTTGGQMAPTSLAGQITTTTPEGRDVSKTGFPIHAAEMIATFKGTAYSARGAVNNPYNYERTREYLKAAFQKQMSNVGLSFVEVICDCPSNWHLSPADSLKWIEEKMIPEFPLGEFKNVDKIE
ncbi:MAG: thiamine pyrophosphate-dependent enzyme [Chloroflexota bacterium]|nr:thiamine pyrophosphate-dependent enzyme [Chloroflexota bacterium]